MQVRQQGRKRKEAGKKEEKAERTFNTAVNSPTFMSKDLCC